jgi:hypothetical protein
MLITRLQEQIEVDLETAHGQVAAGYVDPRSARTQSS